MGVRHFVNKARNIVDDLVSAPIKPAAGEEYCIKAGYHHRTANRFYDDTHNTDKWQREIYEFAAAEAARLNAQRVIDIGCGSGFKLVKYFPDLATIGYDLEKTVAYLKRRYPDRDWRIGDFDKPITVPAEIVICSDVIEHIPDPDFLMRYLGAMTFQKLIISTPERKLLYGGAEHDGPPTNRSHCREWAFDELARYVGQFFAVEKHEVTNASQATQMIVCRKHK